MSQIVTYTTGMLHNPIISNPSVTYSGIGGTITETGFVEGYRHWIKNFSQVVYIGDYEVASSALQIRSDYLCFIATPFPTTVRPQVNITYSFTARYL